MGQQLAVPTGFNNTNEGFSFPPWYNPHFDVKPITISKCKETLLSFSNGNHTVYQHIQKNAFDKISTPLQFMYRQLFLRLFIVSPAFIRKNLNINDNNNQVFRAKDVLKTEFANSFFNDIVMEFCNRLSLCTTLEQIEGTYKSLMMYFNQKYGIDAYLFCDIGTVMLMVLSDCIGETFIDSFAAWIDYLSKGLKTLIELNLTSNGLGSFSLRETMRKLNQPYIDWSDGILSTGYLPIDRQHHWLLTIVNISFVIIVVEP